MTGLHRLINIDQLNIDWIKMTQLTALEAAARLGVKRQTLYAYVSRGLLHRTLSLDGRTSLFEQSEVDSLRQRNRAKAGEVAAMIVTSITEITDAGHAYRGQFVADLVSADTDFEAVVDLVLGSTGTWEVDSGIIANAISVQELLPSQATLLNRLATAVTVTSSSDALRQTLTPSRVAQCARSVINTMILSLPERSRAVSPSRLADHLWGRLAPEPGTPEQRRALNGALVLLVDHGMAASTFSARIAASVRSDPYSMVLAGLGPVSGVHHGAASSQVHRLLARSADVGPEVAVAEKLAAGERIPGVGHVIYKGSDARKGSLAGLVRAGWADDERLKTVTTLDQIIKAELDLSLNIDFALGSLTWLSGMEPDAGHLFAIARTAGWLAHGIEELAEEPIRFRPVAKYVTPAPPGVKQN